MRKRRALILLLSLYPSWLAMMAVHEAGHVAHAWVSGGTVSAAGRGAVSKAGAYLIVVRVPEFAGDSAVVRLGRRCLNTMGGRRETFAKDEVLVFRRESGGWALVDRAAKTN